MFNVSCRYDLFDTRSSFQLAALKFNKVGTAVLSSLFLRWKRMEKHYIHLPKIQFYHKILYQKKLKSQPYRRFRAVGRKRRLASFIFAEIWILRKTTLRKRNAEKRRKPEKISGSSTGIFYDRNTWRHHPESNWRWRFCRPLPYRLAMVPYSVDLLYSSDTWNMHKRRSSILISELRFLLYT